MEGRSAKCLTFDLLSHIAATQRGGEIDRVTLCLTQLQPMILNISDLQVKVE